MNKSIFAFLVLLYTSSFSQSNWIKYDQKYVKVPVAETGIYSIKKSELAELGLSTVKDFLILNKGKSIPILNNEDTIEFYGQKNTGEADSIYYKPFSSQPHQKYSLFTDTSYYYITNTFDEFSKNEITEIKNEPNNNSILDVYPFLETIIFKKGYTHNDYYGPSPTIRPYYNIPGEGFTSESLRKEIEYQYSFQLKDACYSCNSKIETKVLLNDGGRGSKYVKISNSNFIDSVYLNNYSPVWFSTNTQLNNFSKELTLYSSGDFYSISLMEANYSRNLNIDSTSYKLEITNNNTNLNFSKNSLTPNFFKIEGDKITKILPYEESNQEVKVAIKDPSTLFVTGKTLSPQYLEAFTPTNNYDLECKFLIITSKKLKQSSEKYASYKESDEGGNFNTKIFYIEDLANDFSYGEINPLTIKHFLKFYLKESKPQFLLLIGKATSIYLSRTNNKYASENLVPTYGYPASDYFLSTETLNNIEIPNLALGRIPAKTNEEVEIYLNKLIKHNKAEKTIYSKSIVHISGGKSNPEQSSLSSLMQTLSNYTNESKLGLKISAFTKKTFDPIEKIDISEYVNNGSSLISFVGHSAYKTTEMDIGFVSDPEFNYNETNRYPVLFFNGCNFTNTFNIHNTMAENWLFTKEKGAIGIIGQSNYAYVSQLTYFMERFYLNLTNNSNELTLGEISANTIKELLLENKDDSFLYQNTFLGDPSLKILDFNKPDYTFDNNSLENQFLEIDSVSQIKLEIPILNIGNIEDQDKITLNIVQTDGITTAKETIELYSPTYSDTLNINLNIIPNLEQIDLSLITKTTSKETEKTNNTFTFNFNKNNTTTLINNTPILFSLIDENKPKLYQNSFNNSILKVAVQNFSGIAEELKLNAFYRIENEQNTSELILDSTKISGNEKIFYYSFNKLIENNTYEIFLRAVDSNNLMSNKGKYNQLKVIIDNDYNEDILIYPNPTTNCINLKTPRNNSISIIEITDINGRLIDKVNFNTKEGNVHKYCFKNNTSNGIYIYRIINEFGILKSGKLKYIN